MYLQSGELIELGNKASISNSRRFFQSRLTPLLLTPHSLTVKKYQPFADIVLILSILFAQYMKIAQEYKRHTMSTSITQCEMDMLHHNADALRAAVLSMHGKALSKLVSLILMNASMNLSIKGFRSTTMRVPEHIEIDENDVLDDLFYDLICAAEQAKEKTIEARNECPSGLYYWHIKLMLSIVARQFSRMCIQAESLRQYVLEHDADLSPRGQVFFSADSLIHHLRHS